MKKLMTLLALSGAATGAFASETPIINAEAEHENFAYSQHELYPTIKLMRHKEADYNYDKIIGGVQYNYFRSSGVNFNSFAGYSIYRDKSYFTVDGALKYVFNYSKIVDVYPKFTMSSVSHFDTTEDLQMFQIYRTTFDAALGAVYKFPDIAEFDLTLSWFKDLATTCILHRGDEFWGKSYYSPSGLKVGLDIRFPCFMSKSVEVGGYYAQTIKTCYKEYGIKTAIVLAF